MLSASSKAIFKWQFNLRRKNCWTFCSTIKSGKQVEELARKSFRVSMCFAGNFPLASSRPSLEFANFWFPAPPLRNCSWLLVQASDQRRSFAASQSSYFIENFNLIWIKCRWEFPNCRTLGPAQGNRSRRRESFPLLGSCAKDCAVHTSRIE